MAINYSVRAAAVSEAKNDSNFVQLEMAQQEAQWFDLQPIEKKLIAYSLGIGVALLVVFIFGFYGSY
ncbi:MAG: hypothetical protein E6713_00150 [Sporomusaceae bacterium]|nr:hypothetical protein [Sporomusaceae bacterium]